MQNGFYSVAFTDAQYGAIPDSLPPLTQLPIIHGSHCMANGNGSVRELATAEQIAARLASIYPSQIPDAAAYDGPLVIDYEPHTGEDGPNGRRAITIDELNGLLVDCVSRFREVLPNASIAVWGHPTPAIFTGEGTRAIEPEELQPLWEVVDWVCYHDYTGADKWHTGQRNLTASRIAAAHYPGLPVVQAVCPRLQPNKPSFIPPDVLEIRVHLASQLGAEGFLYWDGRGPAEKVSPDFFARWRSDAAALGALVAPTESYLVTIKRA